MAVSSKVRHEFRTTQRRGAVHSRNSYRWCGTTSLSLWTQIELRASGLKGFVHKTLGSDQDHASTRMG
ncbi:hypothetical protein MCOR21_009536 [Pyricularia oryzae]|nr:hypothetical protein MCOR21_009536 [Pyricularia oryzae]